MTKKDKLRRLNFLMYKNYVNSLSFENSKKQILEIHNEYLKNDKLKSQRKHHFKAISGFVEIFNLAKELKINDEELQQLWYTRRHQSNKNRDEYKKTPQKEGRDNKNVHVGGGGSNRNKVRYPSKKRSLSTWKKFYKLFPRNAEEDGWDGKTSNRMK